MANISVNGMVNIYRGDTFRFPLFINTGSKLDPVKYFLKEGDQLYFVIAEPHQPFEEGVVRKSYTYEDQSEEGDIIIELIPEDTENLTPGTYYIEVKIKLVTGEQATIIPRRKFIIYE